MSMDELIRGIEHMDAENMQDLLDAVVNRYRQLFPGYSLMLLTLPEDDPEERNRQLTEVWKLLRKSEK